MLVLRILGRIRIATVRIAVADRPVAPVDHDLGGVLLSNRNRSVDSVALGIMDGRRPRVARAPHGPSLGVRDNVLIRNGCVLAPTRAALLGHVA